MFKIDGLGTQWFAHHILDNTQYLLTDGTLVQYDYVLHDSKVYFKSAADAEKAVRKYCEARGLKHVRSMAGEDRPDVAGRGNYWISSGKSDYIDKDMKESMYIRVDLGPDEAYEVLAQYYKKQKEEEMPQDPVVYYIECPIPEVADAIVAHFRSKGYTVGGCSQRYLYIRVNQKLVIPCEVLQAGGSYKKITIDEALVLIPNDTEFKVGGSTVKITPDLVLYDGNSATKDNVKEVLGRVFSNRLNSAYSLEVTEGQMALGCLKGSVAEFREVYNFLVKETK